MANNEKIILVIDDEEGACDFVKSFLEAREYTVLTTPSGKEGIDIIKTKSPRLVLLDMRMPEMNGLDVLTELKKDNILANIYLMTGVEEGEELDKAKALGIKGILKKPVQLQELSEIAKASVA